MKKKKFIGTFGQGQKFDGFCQPIFADDMLAARQAMFKEYGGAWFTVYPEEEWEEWIGRATEMGLPIERELPPITV